MDVGRRATQFPYIVLNRAALRMKISCCHELQGIDGRVIMNLIPLIVDGPRC